MESDDTIPGVYDYLVNERADSHERGNWLLDDRTGEANAHLNGQTAGLAAIASAIHKHAGILSGEQLEQAVRWLKQYKLARIPLKRNNHGPLHRNTFLDELQRLRNSPEQGLIMNRAWHRSLMARAVAILFGVAAVLTLWLFVDDGIRWWLRAGSLISAIALLITSDQFNVQAAVLYKEQDRKFLLGAFGVAESLTELSQAGLFAGLPAAYAPGNRYDEKAATEEILRERDRLTDALYRDPDLYLTLRS